MRVWRAVWEEWEKVSYVFQLAPYCRTTTKRPPWHLRTPLRTRQGNTELAPDCRTITRPPSGICEHLHRPARGTQELASNCYTKLAPTSLPYTYEHGTPLPLLYTLRPLPTVINHSHHKQANRRRLKGVAPGSYVYSSLTVRE